MSVVCRVLVWALLGVCCVLPLAWVVLQGVGNVPAWAEARVDAHRLNLILRTFGYNALVACCAVVVSLPAAWVIGRGSRRARGVVLAILPVTLLLPSIVYAYGWSQFLRLIDVRLAPQSWQDVARCIGSLTAWLWPVPAGVIGLALRRLDQNLQQQALMDGVLWRVTIRQLLAPLVVSGTIVMGLAVQEFAVYEPTGVSVLATEVRMVYETGAFSSGGNPITQPMAGGSAGSDPSARATDQSARATDQSARATDQSARATAAVVVGLPGLVMVMIGAGVAWAWVRRAGAHDTVDAGPLPDVLRAGRGALVMALVVGAVAVVVPVGSMVLSLKVVRPVGQVMTEFSPQVIGSLGLATGAGAVALLGGALLCVVRVRGAVALGIGTFLIGGQILAIALVRLYNHPMLEGWMYNGPGVMVTAYVARFGWIALLVGAMTWGKPWRELRDMAAIDGADASTTARHVVLPLVWPTLLAAGVFVMILSLTEVPATVLLASQRPPTFTPMLMQWVHLVRSDPMIEGSLLIVFIVLVAGATGTVLLALGAKVFGIAREGRMG